jgi:MFS family permease
MACYTVNLSMSVVGNISPLLFITFRNTYGISYSLLGLLVLVNFVTQLTVDLIFSFFSHKFNIEKTVKLTPVITVIGLWVYALWPLIFPSTAFAGILVGTVIFSASSGLVEVLISPVIAAIPADDPDREMSKLHSVYAWGVVGFILISTLFMLVFKNAKWQIIPLVFSLLPITSACLFSRARMPEMKTPEKLSGVFGFLKNKSLYLCFFAIFLGGAAECTMAQWSSGYIERALGISKIWGDVFGVAMFAAMLGLGRTLYSKFGRGIEKVLLTCAVGATVCYFVAAVSPIGVIGLIACALTGICTSVLWPGCLIVAADKFPDAGVFIYAVMAAGGDLGASVAPQLVGIIADATMAIPAAAELAIGLSMSAEQLGMKLGMLFGMLFPLAAIFLYGYLCRIKKKGY